ncbi:phosphopantetheine-binding protein [Altererythrobacter xixiisoli]|uniref:Phosphopantetheine-binding protein n=1 Tax=Croceibacterium xixiisoli TaxID=1476466 RepID=A0A6I4TNZ4_9SPHN|nr:phosphopantetheine-binding protein [Croceibacterium xixiisoli]MXO97506.1 phosphopantetheine-binding protein [Croceibacterium xixiisoli]
MSTMTLEKLRADIAALLEDAPESFGDDENLMDLGLDSMRAMNLAMQWDEDGVPLDFADLAEAPTVAGLWALLSERQG